MINNKKFHILIIDNNEDFNNQLSEKINLYKFNTTQIFKEDEILECITKSHSEFDLILLNIDFDDDTSTKIFDFISSHTKSKIILLSKEDIGEKREEYFAQGILDYHITSQKLDHIVDDIVDTIYSLYTNKKEVILIIDSSEIFCKKLEKILLTRNYQVLWVCRAKEGLEILKNNEISLLILDMEIEDINAHDLLEGLREMYLLSQFFVLALSKNKSPSIVRDSLKNGAKDFLMKPFLYEEFLLKIDILISSLRNKKIANEQTQEIKSSLKSFKELLDSSIGAMFVFEEYICVNCNNEAIKILGYKSKKDIVNKKIFEIFTDISETHKKELLNDTIEHNFEDTIISKGSIQYEVQIKERNIVLNNKMVKIIALLDITDLKRNEKIISQQTKMASMGEMIGNIAHQWRQPLTAISVAAGGIKLGYELDMCDTEETICELDNIVDNTKFLSATIESFQNFLKDDKIISNVNIKSACKKTLSIINSNLKVNKIEIIEDFDSDKIVIRGIENEVVQVLLNIINNASDVLKSIKSINEKYIKISIFNDDKNVFVSVHDNGNGIDDTIINKIFEPYFTTKHKSQGTGLGLYMTHKIIEKMNSEISVKNDSFSYNNSIYNGAKFTISFPFNQ